MMTEQNKEWIESRLASLRSMLRDDPRLPARIIKAVEWFLDLPRTDAVDEKDAIAAALRALSYLPDDFGKE